MDKYENESIIGHGSFGSVWLVKSRQDNSLYCMKRLDGAAADSITEAQIHAGLQHPYIIRYEEVVRKLNNVYIFMEYAAGGDLASQLSKRARSRDYLSEEIVLVWSNHILHALAYMHRRGMVHRDVKSANVFITHMGIAKLGDMGCSKILDANASRYDQRTCTTPCGTPMYQAPEQYNNSPYTQKVDIWALGCVIYEMCTLRPTFEGRNIQELGYNVTRGAYNRRLPPKYTRNARGLIESMLIVDPYRRPLAKELLIRPCIAKYDNCCVNKEGITVSQHTMKKSLPKIPKAFDKKDDDTKADVMKIQQPILNKQWNDQQSQQHYEAAPHNAYDPSSQKPTRTQIDCENIIGICKCKSTSIQHPIVSNSRSHYVSGAKDVNTKGRKFRSLSAVPHHFLKINQDNHPTHTIIHEQNQLPTSPLKETDAPPVSSNTTSSNNTTTSACRVKGITPNSFLNNESMHKGSAHCSKHEQDRPDNPLEGQAQQSKQPEPSRTPDRFLNQNESHSSSKTFLTSQQNLERIQRQQHSAQQQYNLLCSLQHPQQFDHLRRQQQSKPHLEQNLLTQAITVAKGIDSSLNDQKQGEPRKFDHCSSIHKNHRRSSNSHDSVASERLRRLFFPHLSQQNIASPSVAKHTTNIRRFHSAHEGNNSIATGIVHRNPWKVVTDTEWHKQIGLQNKFKGFR